MCGHAFGAAVKKDMGVCKEPVAKMLRGAPQLFQFVGADRVPKGVEPCLRLFAAEFRLDPTDDVQPPGEGRRDLW